jgi:hypothetical protein
MGNVPEATSQRSLTRGWLGLKTAQTSLHLVLRSFRRPVAIVLLRRSARLPYEPINDAGWPSLPLCRRQSGTECRSPRPCGIATFFTFRAFEIFRRQIQPKWMASHIICEPFMLGDKNLLIASANGNRTPNLILRSALAS